MKAPPPFRGMMPILPTPITPAGDLDEASQRRLVRYALACGAVAIGHFGFASEFFKLTDTQRRRITEIVIDETAGRVPVFLGVTGASDAIAVEYARQAEALGASLLMLAIPYVSVPDTDATFRYFDRVSAVTSLPIIVQDTPLSDAMLTPAFVAKMFNEIEHVAHIKAEGKDFLAKAVGIAEATGGHMPVIGGFGGKHMLQLLRVGVTSFMTGTEYLDLHAAVVAAFLRGDGGTAARLYYEKLLPYFVFYDAYPEELLKAMLHARGVIDCPAVIPPRSAAPMGPAVAAEFRWILDRIGFDSTYPQTFGPETRA